MSKENAIGNIKKTLKYTAKTALIGTSPADVASAVSWAEMQKHQPFGWVKGKEDEHRALITAFDDNTYGMSFGNAALSSSEIMDIYTFADGATFGVKEE